MNKTLLAGLVAGLMVIAIGAAVWSTRTAPAAVNPALPDFDYASPTSWAARPDIPPPAVWETDWAIDVLLLARREALETGDAAALEKQSRRADEEIDRLADAFSETGTVYAPFLRAENFDADVLAAVNQYLTTDNRGRAFIIATDAPVPSALAASFDADPLLRDRFGGVLMFADEPDAGLPPASFAAGLCSRRYEAAEGCVVPVTLKRNGNGYDMTGADALTNGLLSWLKTHASRLAEPLGELEEIEIIEIQKPPEPE